MSDKQVNKKNGGRAAGTAAGVAVIAAVIAFFSTNGGQTLMSGGGSGGQETEAAAESQTLTEDITIKIDTTDVYVGDEKLSYTKGDTEDLKAALKKKMEELLTDSSSVYLEYENGDYNTYQAVKEVLGEMSVTPIEVKEN